MNIIIPFDHRYIDQEYELATAVIYSIYEEDLYILDDYVRERALQHEGSAFDQDKEYMRLCDIVEIISPLLRAELEKVFTKRKFREGYEILDVRPFGGDLLIHIDESYCSVEP